MLSILLIKYASSQTKVYHVYNRGYFSDSHHDVVRLDISMNHSLLVHEFQPGQDLTEKHQAGLQTKLAAAEIEEIFKRWAQQFLDHEYEVVLNHNARVVQLREALT